MGPEAPANLSPNPWNSIAPYLLSNATTMNAAKSAANGSAITAAKCATATSVTHPPGLDACITTKPMNKTITAITDTVIAVCAILRSLMPESWACTATPTPEALHSPLLWDGSPTQSRSAYIGRRHGRQRRHPTSPRCRSERQIGLHAATPGRAVLLTTAPSLWKSRATSPRVLVRIGDYRPQQEHAPVAACLVDQFSYVCPVK